MKKISGFLFFFFQICKSNREAQKDQEKKDPDLCQSDETALLGWKLA